MRRDAAPEPTTDGWTVEYYETESGNVPVLEWIERMSPRAQADVLGYIEQLASLGLEAHCPLVAPLGDGLYELRWKSEDKQHRIAYFAIRGRTFVLLHGIVKKQWEWPKKELKLAQKRMRDYERRNS